MFISNVLVVTGWRLLPQIFHAIHRRMPLTVMFLFDNEQPFTSFKDRRIAVLALYQHKKPRTRVVRLLL